MIFPIYSSFSPLHMKWECSRLAMDPPIYVNVSENFAASLGNHANSSQKAPLGMKFQSVPFVHLFINRYLLIHSFVPFVCPGWNILTPR